MVIILAVARYILYDRLNLNFINKIFLQQAGPKFLKPVSSNKNTPTSDPD
jgi:hypothetical protein